jgi:uncharacterized protein YuzE
MVSRRCLRRLKLRWCRLNSAIVRQVENWYLEHSESQLKVCTRFFIRSIDSDALDGKVEIGLETASTVASITLWNRGAVMVIAIDKQSKKDLVLDDRKLEPDEDVRGLLDRHVRKLTDLEGGQPISSS